MSRKIRPMGGIAVVRRRDGWKNGPSARTLRRSGTSWPRSGPPRRDTWAAILEAARDGRSVSECMTLGREVLKQCSDTLLPLREEIRQHNTLSGAISGLLGQIRKRGLTATLRSRGLPL